jgi:methylenetetrahydrofolate reductase (NADPH)
MPIQTYSSFARLTKLCGTRVPACIAEDLAPISVGGQRWKCSLTNLFTKQHDDQLVKDYGIKLAVQMIRRLRSEGGIQGFHFCTLNLEKSVQRVLETLRWAGVTPPVHNKLIQVREVSRHSSVT